MIQRLSPRRIGGRFCAVVSKSHAQRALLCAALADRPTTYVCGALPQDVEAMLRCLSALGAEVTHGQNAVTVRPPELPRGDITLDCGESGATLRFLLPVAAALGVSAEFVLHGRLAERPIDTLLSLLNANGCTAVKTGERITCEGRLRSGVFALPGNISSQYVSGLLFALPLMPGNSEIRLTSAPESEGYIAMTLEMLERFSVRVTKTASGWYIPGGQQYHSCGRITAEGDWSAASMFFCAGAFSAPVVYEGLPDATMQPDRRLPELLREFGAEVSFDGILWHVNPARLRGICIDAGGTPDLVPALALTATAAEGETRIFGAARLRYKESDRLRSICEVLTRLGASVRQTDDGLCIVGSPLSGGEVDPQNDHRIAMLTGVASARCAQSVSVRRSECAAKSYPDFWRDLKQNSREREP